MKIPVSPLRYPGGKSRLAPFIKSIFRENNLAGTHYIEPYAGGASVGLSLLFENYVSGITINDLDKSIYAFWHSILHETDRFCRKISNTKVSPHNWRIQRNIQRKKEEADLFSLGFSTFFLNRTNVSGVLGGGIIGGYNQKGNYKIDARYNKAALIASIEKIAKSADKITVEQLDAQKLIKKDRKETFLYLDPPYVKKGKKLYRNTYNENDHTEISDLILAKKKSFWILSYDRHELIDRLYGQHPSHLSWQLSYGTSNKAGIEDIFLHPTLKFDNSVSYLKGGEVVQST